MKKFVRFGVLFCSVLAVFLLTAGTSSPAKAAEQAHFGDLDLSGSVTVSDALTALRGGVGLASLTTLQKLQADVDGDGNCSVTDALSVLRYAVGLTSTFSIPTYTAHINAADVRLRAAPKDGAELDQMQSGEQVTVYGTAIDDWYHVQYASVEGYSSAAYVTVDSAISAPPTPSQPSTPSTPSQGNTQTGNTRLAMTTDNVNFRTGPGTNYGKVEVSPNPIPAGTSVTVYGEAENGWYHVRFNGKDGYCSADYILVDSGNAPAVTTPLPAESTRFAMTTASLHLRSGPGTGYGILTTISPGTVVVVIGEQQNGFYPVCYYKNFSPQNGWCSADYITFTLRASLSTQVKNYGPTIQKYAEQYGIPQYVELIQAVMMQESGGRGLDPMQAAEGGCNKLYPHVPNGITDPEYSIECGVQELRKTLLSAGVRGPQDLERISLALQSYNFGSAYLSWARETYGGYSYANAVEFSDRMVARPNWPYSIYGDKLYVPHVLRYYPYS